MKNQQVLVVDDEELVLDTVMMMLEAEQIANSGAKDCKSARVKLEAQFYAVVVTDIRLNTVEEGLLLLDEIRALAPDSRVICMSGFVTNELEAEVRSRGARIVLEKMDAAATLIAAVQELLAEVEKLAAEQQPLDLEQLYASTRRLMHSIPMRRYGLSLEQAEDVVHEAWMLFLERLGIVRQPRQWLAGTVAKLSLRHRVRSGREIFDDELLGTMEDDCSSDWATILSVRTALAGIDSRSRLLCTMIGMEGRSYSEVSEQTGYALGAIGPLYIRAKQRLRKALGH
jgi:RNA polymerase sigma factor (sigma-70 family)